jgi:hypothetical protein
MKCEEIIGPQKKSFAQNRSPSIYDTVGELITPGDYGELEI